ncbi:hypothetical protein GF336_02890 [Candidatus Woesearchaeota archaeon]|nr:hypothetical protein [Candidatus Woesearchaeota archaeon]
MVETKHLTIMFTDIKGFTSRTSLSSREQLHKMLELHENLIIPAFRKFKGKVIKTIGDAFMVTFHSPTDAVLCGMRIQEILDKHNKENPEDSIEVRVAINSGEATVKDDDVFGEAVNIASRLEGIADAGDIYFTESVYLAMNKAEIPTAKVGYRHFKGIPEEIKVYKVLREKKNKRFFSKRYKPVKRTYSPGKKRIYKFLRWGGIAFVLLLILIQCSEINKQKEEKEIFQEQVIRENEDRVRQDIKQEKIDEITSVSKDVIDAIKQGDERRARKGIEFLIEASDRYENTEELKKHIQDLEIRYKERFN